jgi:protein TonB
MLIAAAVAMTCVPASSYAAARARAGTAHQEHARVTAPVLVKEVKPKYTEGAMRRKVEGRVVLSAVVKADGKVGDVDVTESLDPELDEQAIAAAKQWEFKPGTRDGEPVSVRISLELSFTLKK